jgi:hypothetical protein
VSAALLALTLSLATAVAGETPDRPVAPLLQGMGGHHLALATTPEARRYLDQGMVLAFGCNHREAARSSRQAQLIDPECVMCCRDEAPVLGPSFNAGMDAAGNPRAYAAARQALALADGSGEPDRALIEALVTGYAVAAPEDRGALDAAYAEAMGEVARRFPDDPDVGACAPGH